MKLKIRYKIFFGFALVLTVAFLTLTVGYRITDSYVRKQIAISLYDKAEVGAAGIQNFITRTELDHLGISKTYRSDTDPTLSETTSVVEYTLRQNPYYNKITLLTKGGREVLVVSKFGRTQTHDLSYEIPTGPYEEALLGKTTMSKVYFPENTSIAHVDVFSPITMDNGNVTGVVKSQITLDRLWDLIAQVKLGSTGFAYVVDDEGRLIAHPDREFLAMAPNLSGRTALMDVSVEPQINKFYTYRNQDNEVVVANASIIPETGWIVVAEQSLAEAMYHRNLLRNISYSTLSGSFVLLILIALVLSRNITYPIEQLRKATRLIQSGNLSAQAFIRSGDEIEELASSFNIMTYKLRSAFTELNRKIAELNKTTEQLVHEKGLAEAERNKFQILLAGITDCVLAVDLERKIILVNPSAERVTGYKADEVVGRPLSEVISIFDNKQEVPLDAYCPLVVGRFEGVVYKKEKVYLVGKNGKKTYINITSGQIREGLDTNLGVIITFHDIAQEEELEKMKLDFVSIAAHELRTPLTTVLGYLSFLRDEKVSNKLTEQEKEFLKRVNLSATRLNLLIENLLVVSRIEQGTMVLNKENVQLENLVDKLLSEFMGLAHSKGLLLEFRKSSTLSSKVNIDPMRIEEVVANLVGNAINYTQKGGVTVSIHERDDGVVFSVRDTGQGIPEDAISHLFTKFFRIQGELESGSKGTGLGLYISKSIIDAHGGKIWVESKVGVGSTFYFCLPVSRAL